MLHGKSYQYSVQRKKDELHVSILLQTPIFHVKHSEYYLDLESNDNHRYAVDSRDPGCIVMVGCSSSTIWMGGSYGGDNSRGAFSNLTFYDSANAYWNVTYGSLRLSTRSSSV